MRVVGGNLGGRRLAVPRNGTRPTSDRVRQALFDRLRTRVVGAEVLDLFAGSGGLGIEALSRGAKRALFVEVAPPVARILRENLAALDLEERAEVWTGGAARALRRLRTLGRRFDLVFMDPPYAADVSGELGLLSGVLGDEGLVVLEQSKRHPLMGAPEGLRMERNVRYGETELQFLEVLGAVFGSDEPHEGDVDASGVSGHL